jgi:hypothetical protein
VRFVVVEEFWWAARKAADFHVRRRWTRPGLARNGSSARTSPKLELELPHAGLMSIAATLKRAMATPPPKDSRKVLEGIIGMSMR